ncbi:restriction endonuclease subunit S [Reichenbachiella sp. MALMAid0571]|uniref:restriction endonuclease subunit S n=1 Tax=Reichenbachiella sp. MALMAid0571 TaxID=3143939 RepID=UPI0032DECA20
MSKEFVKYELPKGWVWTTIGELGVVMSGGTPSTRERRYWSGNIPWISPADLTGYKEKYIEKGNKSITQDGLDEPSTKLVPKGRDC